MVRTCSLALASTQQYFNIVNVKVVKNKTFSLLALSICALICQASKKQSFLFLWTGQICEIATKSER